MSTTTGAERQVARWIAAHGLSEAARRAYTSGGSTTYRAELLAAVRRAEG